MNSSTLRCFQWGRLLGVAPNEVFFFLGGKRLRLMEEQKDDTQESTSSEYVSLKARILIKMQDICRVTGDLHQKKHMKCINKR